MVTVQWDQWFRCGRYGDDADFETHTMDFDDRDDAVGFMNDLIAGKHRGRFDMRVHESDITVIDH